MKIINSFVLIACLAAPVSAQTPSSAAPAAAANVAGTWDVTFNAAQGPIPAQIKLTKNGEAKLTGTVTSDLGSSQIEAEVKAKAVTIWFDFASQNGVMAIQMTGTADGDSMKGTMTAGGQPAGDWVATRAKDAATTTTAASTSSTASTASAKSLSGTWNVSVELPNMTANPTIVLKQDGEKLTGDYVSAQYGKFAITGTAKGSDVTFGFSMAIEGSPLNVNYTGTVQKDGSLAGSVNYGDMMSGTFTATLKK